VEYLVGIFSQAEAALLLDRIWCNEASWHSSGRKPRPTEELAVVVISSSGKGTDPLKAWKQKSPEADLISLIRTGERAT
jgi:hypothetical protein